MNAVRKHVQQAQRRLNTNILFDRLTGALLTGSLAAGVTLIVQRLLNLDAISWSVFVGLAGLLFSGWLLLPGHVSKRQLRWQIPMLILASGALAGLAYVIVHFAQPAFQELHLVIAAAVVTLIVAGIDTALRQISTLEAAVRLDEAAGVRERISTAVALPNSSDPFVQATHRDAERVAATVHVPSRLPLRVPERTPWSVIALMAMLGIYAFLPQYDLLAWEKQREDESSELAKRAEKTEVVAVVNRELKAISEMSKAHPELAGLADDLDPLDVPNGPDATPEDVRRDALLKLEKATDKLESKLMNSDASMIEQLKKNLSKLKPPGGNDAASELGESLAKGDMQAAGAALEKLKEQLESQSDSSNPETQAKLKELSAKLDDLAKQLDKLSDKTALEKTLENQAGLSKEEDKKLLEKLAQQGVTDPKALEKLLQQQLGDKLTPEQLQKLAEKMAQNNKACQACKGLAQSLQKAAQACQNPGGQQGQNQQAAGQALGEAMGQLSDLEMAEQMMQDLQAQLAQLDGAKQGVCQGAGGDADQPQNQPRGTGRNRGLGYGDGIGKDKVAHKTQRERAVGKLSNGQIIGEVLVNGPLQRTESGAAVRDAVQSAVRDAEDAVQREDVPRQYHKSMKSYFDKLAGLAPAESK